MTKEITQLIVELRAELKHAKCKLVLQGDRLLVVMGNRYTDTYINVDTRLQEKAHFDPVIY